MDREGLQVSAQQPAPRRVEEGKEAAHREGCRACTLRHTMLALAPAPRRRAALAPTLPRAMAARAGMSATTSVGLLSVSV